MNCSRSILESWSSGDSTSPELELAKLAMLLGFGVHLEGKSDRAALEALVEIMATSKGPLEIWKQLTLRDPAGKLPITAGLEEMRAFVNVAMPEDDIVASTSYLATAYGLSPGGQVCYLGYDKVSDHASDLMSILRGADVLELPSVIPEREATILQRAREIAAQAQDWISSVSTCLLPSSSESQDGQQMQEVLHRELNWLLRTLVVVLESVTCVVDVLEGSAQDSKTSDDVFVSLWNNLVPSVWDLPNSLDSAGGSSLSMWLRLIGNRVQYFQRWSQEGLPVSCWLGALTSPQHFLVAILRRYAVEQVVDVDELDLVPEATSIRCSGEAWRPEEFVPEEMRPAKGSFVHGLALFGAAWALDVDTTDGFLDDRPPSLDEDCWLPVLALLPMHPKDRHDGGNELARFSCPVYRRASEKFALSGTPLLHLDLPSSEETQLWALRGVSLFLELPT